MRREPRQNTPKSSAPATYRICVQGSLEEKWSDRLGGMSISQSSRPDQTTVTVLVGRVRDQAALAGVLNTLYDLHLPILSVEALPNEQ